MKQLFKLIHAKLKTWYYYQELKEVSMAAVAVFAAWFLFNYGPGILQWMKTENGQLYTVFFMAATVMCIAIKMYYRVMVIKYHEKDIKIELFKELTQNKK